MPNNVFIKYSRRAFYFRKYIYVYILIFFLFLILLKFMQLTADCSKRRESASFVSNEEWGRMFIGVEKVRLWDSKIIILTKILKKVDQSRKNENLLVEAGVASLGKMTQKNAFNHAILSSILIKQTFSERTYYNSINDQNFISFTSRLISAYRCRFRLIEGRKYYKKKDWFSDYSILLKFVDAQAKLNRYLKSVFLKSFSGDLGHLASGVLIGAQGNISMVLKKQLIATGLIHVVVASGYNLTLVGEYIRKTLQVFISKKYSLLVSLFVIWWYVVLAGMNPSVIRAGWMGSLSILASVCGRPYSQLRALLLSALVMLVFDPSLLTNISFQLSLSATIGVILVNCKQTHAYIANEKFDLLQKSINAIKENAVTTFGANLFTLPIIIFWFGRISVISIVANTALLWIIPLLMISAFCFLITIHVHYLFALIFILSTKVIGGLFLLGVELFAKVPFATVTSFKMNVLHVCFFYLCLFIIFQFRSFKQRRERINAFFRA